MASSKQKQSDANSCQQVTHQKARSINMGGGCQIANQCRKQPGTIKNRISE